jgi:protein SCO1/2
MLCGVRCPGRREENAQVLDGTLPERVVRVLWPISSLFFGYTFCPDVCPVTLGIWKRVHEALGEDARQVRFVFITVDPERDTPERLLQHVAIFNPEFIGLTGTPEALQPVYQTFGVFFEKESASKSAVGYLVSHTASAFVVDRAGQWRLRHAFETPADDIVHDIVQLLE